MFEFCFGRMTNEYIFSGLGAYWKLVQDNLLSFNFELVHCFVSYINEDHNEKQMLYILTLLNLHWPANENNNTIWGLNGFVGILKL